MVARWETISRCKNFFAKGVGILALSVFALSSGCCDEDAHAAVGVWREGDMKIKIYDDGRWIQLTGPGERESGQVEFLDSNTVRFQGDWAGKTGVVRENVLVVDEKHYERVVK